MKRTTIMADEQLLLEAQHLATQRHITFSALVQDALREYLTAYRPQRRLSFIGIGRGNGLLDDMRDGKDEEILAKAVHPIYGWAIDRDDETDPSNTARCADADGRSR